MKKERCILYNPNVMNLNFRSPRIFKPMEVMVGLQFVPKNKLGPTMIKIGQFASNRPDIFGKDISNSLAPLRDNVFQSD